MFITSKEKKFITSEIEKIGEIERLRNKNEDLRKKVEALCDFLCVELKEEKYIDKAKSAYLGGVSYQLGEDKIEKRYKAVKRTSKEK